MDILLHVARFIHYTAALQLFGVAAFQFVLAAPVLRDSLDRPARRTATISAILLFLSGLLWLAATAATMGDGWQDGFDPAVLWTVLSATAFGRVWGPHLLLCAVLLVLSGLGGTRRWGLLAGLSTLSMISLGLVGHAATETGWLGFLSQTSHALHLISSAFWLGSLLPLLFCIAQFRAHEAESDAALRRFSGLGHLAVALLLLSGVSNSWFVLRDAGLDSASLYQQMLLAKVMIAGVMVCLAVVNRYVFMPRIPSGGPGLRQLAHGTIAEIVLGAGIMGLVSVLGTLPPT